MKNTKFIIAALGLMFGLGLAMSLRADIKFFWLDKPKGRTNCNDPSSPCYATPTPAYTATAVGTPTNTYTFTATNTATYTATQTATQTPVCTPTPAIVMDNFEGTQYGSSAGSWGWVGVTSGTTITLPASMTTGYCSSQSLPIQTTAITTGSGSVDVNSASLTPGLNPTGATTFTMMILAPAAITGHINFTFTSGGVNSFKAGAPFTVVGSPNWQQVVIPVSSFTVTTGGSGAWTPSASTMLNNFEIELDSGTAAQTMELDNIGFGTGAVPTATITPTPTTTPTAVSAGSWPIIFNGTSVPLGGNFFGAGGSAGATVVGSYAQVTLSCAAAGYAAVGAFATGYTGGGVALTQNAAAYSSLSITVMVPATGGNCMVPSVSVQTDNTVLKTSVAVSLETYLVGGPQFMQGNLWYTALVPLSLFTAGTDGTGWNGKAAPNSFTITAADMGQLVAVEVQPSGYASDGSLPLTTVNVSDIQFTNTAATVNASGNTLLFCDFEHGTQANWGDYWSSFEDQDKPDFTCPGDIPTVRTFPTCGNCPNPVPVITPPIDASGSSTAVGETGDPNGTPCHFGHLEGWVGNDAGSPCTGQYAYFGMGVYFTPKINGTYYPTNMIDQLNGYTPKGISMWIKTGNGSAMVMNSASTAVTVSNQPVTVFITFDNFTDSTGPGADLNPTASWTQVQVPFPTTTGPINTVDAACSGGCGPGSGVWNTIGQPTWDGGTWSSTTWGPGPHSWNNTTTTNAMPAAQTQYVWDASATTMNSLYHFSQLKFQADNRADYLDFMVDDIQFY